MRRTPRQPSGWPVRPADLVAWRESYGLSQAKAAKLLPVATRTWERWEYGQRSPPPFLFRALRDIERELAVR